MTFSIQESSHETRLCYDEQTVGRFTAGIGWHILLQAVLTPGGPEVIHMHSLAPTTMGRVPQRPEVTSDGNQITVHMECRTDDGELRQQTRAVLSLDDTGAHFTWDFVHETTVVKSTNTRCRFFARSDVDPDYADTGAWHLEITDPVPSQPFSPKDGPVPEDRPDIFFPQPIFREGGWEKRWTHFYFTRADGRAIRIPMNHLVNHDKDFWKQAPNGTIAMLGGTGTNLRYRFLEETGTNIFHHYCMWGYDIHFFEVIAPGSGAESNVPPTLQAGRTFRHHYVLEHISDADAATMLATAEEHPWRQRDACRLENAPVYLPGVNQFQASLGRQDDRGFFYPTSTCRYLQHHPGRTTPGVLWIENENQRFYEPQDVPLYNAWSITLGSDNWHHPIARNAVYEVSAWVKLEATGPAAMARIAAGLVVQYDQATPQFRVERPGPWFSNAVQGKTGWTKLTLTLPRMPDDYVCAVRIALELHGRGTAFFDDFEWKRLAYS